MGAFSSTLVGRRNGGVETVDIASNNAYKFPPKTGNFFGSHFIMGGERFDMPQPESYLFGENSDLNYLGSKPIPFPYPTSQGNEPSKTLKSLVNIRKDSLRLIRLSEKEKSPSKGGKDESPSQRYNIEFTFDSDVRCAITIYLFATEEMVNLQLVYHVKEPSLKSETFHFKRGANQVFQQSAYIIEPSKFTEEEWQYSADKEVIPIVIQCVVEEEDHSPSHAHMTFANVEKSSADGCYIVKPLKQKQYVDGLCYLLQEIYGIENKHTETKKDDDDDCDDDVEDSGAECVICMCDMRDTLILPCRHLCLCSTCAESLRYQASNCPICRSPFRALLQIRAMRRKQAIALQQGETNPEENPVSQEGVPPGHEAVSLIEALNGPCGLPPPNTMEGIHVPPPSRHPPPDSDLYSREKRRSAKRRHMPVETVKEMVLSQEDKKIDEEVDQKTEESTTPPLTEQSDTNTESLQKSKSKSRNKIKPDKRQSPPPEKSKEVADRLELVNEVTKPSDLKSNLKPSDVSSQPELEPGETEYPPLAVSSENLADDEREDTSEGELEPEPDYDSEDSYREREEEENGDEDFFCPPPTYSSVIPVDSLGTRRHTDDTDESQSIPLRHGSQLSATPPSTDSASSTNSSRQLLPQAVQSDDEKH